MAFLMGLLIVPLMLLNFLGGIVAFVWLAILGEWREIGIGIAASVAMPFVFAMVSLPTLGLLLLFSWLLERNVRLLALPIGFLASLWTSLLVMAWCSFIFFHYARAATPDTYIPLLLWGYGVVMAPLGYMAKSEMDNAFTALLMFIAQILYIGLVVCFLVGTSVETALILTLIMTVITPSIGLFAGIIMLPKRAT